MKKSTWSDLSAGDQLFNPQYIGVALEVVKAERTGTRGELIVTLRKKGRACEENPCITVTVKPDEQIQNRGYTHIATGARKAFSKLSQDGNS